MNIGLFDCTVTDNNINPNKINSAVVIPAFNPMSELTGYVSELLQKGVPVVIVVNDGSDGSFDEVFRRLEELKRCTVLWHDKNRGKGRALKTAFEHFCQHFSYLDGVVTADADGQHAVEDVCKICEKLSGGQYSLVLGVRDFEKMPKRSYLGNFLSSSIFKLMYNSSINDTQTGLRGITAGELEWMIELSGERYDYEINMLINASYRNLRFTTVSIDTLYFDNNAGTHFNTARDASLIFLKLISGLIRFSGLTIISGIIDVVGFFVLNTFAFAALPASVRIFISTVIARVTSSICNFLMNRNITFGSAPKTEGATARYYILFVLLILASYVMVYAVSLFWDINESIIKLSVDIVLGFISYQVQLRWVFPGEDNSYLPSTAHISDEGE